MLLISIPTPCHEKWDEMTPHERGAFCKVCSKTVVDFTTLSDEEVKNYFLNNRGQKTCGRFRNDQLIDPGDPLPRVLASAIPFWKKFLTIVFFVFGSFLTGCKSEMKSEPSIENHGPRYKKIQSSTMGIIVPGEELEINPEKGTTVQVDECTAKLGTTSEILLGDTAAIPVEMITGEIIIEAAPNLNGIDTTVKKKLDENGNEVIE